MIQTLFRTRNSVLSMLAICCLLTACDKNISYSKVQNIPNQLWYFQDTLVYDLPISESLSGYDVVLSIRNTHSYPYQNIYMKVAMITPKGEKMFSDTIQLFLADKFGHWKGAGWGQLKLNETVLKSNHTFQDTGRYSIVVRHLMRDDYLPGIEDVAISLQKQGAYELKGNIPSNSKESELSDSSEVNHVTL